MLVSTIARLVSMVKGWSLWSKAGLYNREAGLYNREASLYNREAGLYNREASLYYREASLYYQEAGLYYREAGLYYREAGLYYPEAGLRVGWDGTFVTPRHHIRHLEKPIVQSNLEVVNNAFLISGIRLFDTWNPTTLFHTYNMNFRATNYKDDYEVYNLTPDSSQYLNI